MSDAEIIKGFREIDKACGIDERKFADSYYQQFINMVRENDKHDHASFALGITEKARVDERAKTVEACLAAMDNIDWDSEIEEGESLRMVRQAVELEIKGVGGVCEHGKGLTDYCEPCGRIHGGG